MRRRAWRFLATAVMAISMGAFAVLMRPATAHAATRAVDGVVNLNTAPVELLTLLPGIGPSKARAIVIYRTRRPFRTVDELVRVKGIGRRMVREVRSHLAVAGPSTARGTKGVPPALQGPSGAPVPGAPLPAGPRAAPVRSPAGIRGPQVTRPRRPLPGPVRPVTPRPFPRSPANHCAPPA